MKKLVTSYTFDASAQTVDSADFVSLKGILLITNVTDNIIIYNFADSAKGGSLSSTTLTLDFDTTAMDDADDLQIFVDDGSAVPVNNITTGTITANGGTVTASVVDGMAGWTMAYYGTYATGASLTMEASFDGGSTYSTVRMLAGTTSTLGYVLTIAAGVNGASYFTADIPTGATHLRVRCSAWAAPSGTINVIIGQSAERFATSPGAIVLTSGTVTTLTNITNWGNVVDNAAFVDGTTRLMPGGYIYDEVAGTGLTENDAAAARIDVKRAQVGVIEDATTRGQRAAVSAGGALKVDNSAVTQPVSGTFWQATQPVSGTVTANMGTVTADPFGANADAASATGSISAKLRFIASTGIPITGTVTVGSHAVTNAGVFAVQNTPVAPTTIYNGKKTVTTAGTRVTLASSQAVKSVVIKALSSNTGTIYVGDSSVASTTGFQLLPGETISLDIANLNTVNLDSSVNGEGVTYVGTA